MDIQTLFLCIAFMLLFLLLQAFFSGTEIGVVSVNKVRLRHRAADGSKSAELVLKMLERPDWFLSTTLVGTNLMVVANTTLATWLIIQLLGSQWALLSVVIMAPFIWIFGEIVPKSIFQQKSESIVLVAIYALVFFSFVLSPIVFLTSRFSRFMSWISGSGNSGHATLREELRMMLDTSPIDKEIKPQEQDMIKRLFDFNETSAREVMIPLVDVVTVSDDATCSQVLELAAKSYHKLIPVHRERVDNMIGIVDTLQLLGEKPTKHITSLIQSVDYIPVSKSIATLLADMRADESALVIVVDEFGGAEGIVTLEDIMEEVVDEVRDEFDKLEKEEKVVKVKNKEYRVSARQDINELERELDINLKVPEQHTTLASILLEEFGDIPKEGQSLNYQGIVFTVIKARPQAIDEVHIRLP